MILAYLDAGSGSLLLQALLGGVGGIAVAFKAFGSRFGRNRPIPAETELPEEEG